MPTSFRVVLAAALPLLCCFMCVSNGNGDRVVMLGTNAGLVPTRTTNSSTGGVLGLAAGNSGGARETESREANHQASIRVGTISIEGPIDNSTGAGEWGYTILGIGRIIGMTKSVARMFDFAANKDNVDGTTDNVRSDNAARTAQIRSNNEVRRALIQAKP